MRRSKESLKEYIYLLQEREFIRCNEQTFKIGRTKGLNNRFSAYPKDSELLMLCDVDNSVDAERRLIECFKNTFVQQRQYGNEYFAGDVNQMKSVISQLFVTIPKILKPKKMLPTLPIKLFKRHDKPPQKPLPTLPLIKISTLEWRTNTSWKCCKCELVLSSKRSLENHQKRKIPCDHKCEECGKKFKNTRQYTRHIKGHKSVKKKEHVDFYDIIMSSPYC